MKLKIQKALTGALFAAFLAVMAPFSFATGIVDPNTATVDELASVLSGVGPAKAQAIVDYREQYGPFASVEELTAVKGIGDTLLSNNLDRIEIRSPSDQ